MSWLKHNQPKIYKRWMRAYGAKVVPSESNKKRNLREFIESIKHNTAVNVILCMLMCFLLAGCMTMRTNPVQAPVIESGASANMRQQSGFINAQIDSKMEKIADNMSAINDAYTSVSVKMAGIDSMYTSMTTNLKGFDYLVRAQLENVHTSVTLDMMNNLEAKFVANAEARLGDISARIGRDIVTSATADIDAHMSLWQKTINTTLNGRAGRDLDQSQDKYGGAMVASIAALAIVSMLACVYLAYKQAKTSKELRAVQRGLMSQGWTAPLRSGAITRGDIKPKDTQLFNWNAFAPPPRHEFEDDVNRA